MVPPNPGGDLPQENQEVSPIIHQAAAAAQTSGSHFQSEPTAPTPSSEYQRDQIESSRPDQPITDAGPVTRDAALRHEESIHIPPDDSVPPPAYGDHYGVIENEQDGLGTNASVADDGRVNIRINQKSRRLSTLLAPALRTQLDPSTDVDVPPPPYIPPSLGGLPGQTPPPPLNVVIHVVGSRGDVQPFVALGKVLKETYGHRVRLATHPVFKDFVKQNGLDFFNITGDPAELMAFMVKNPGLMPGFDTLRSGDVGKRRKGIASMLRGCWRSCIEAGDGMGLDLDSTIEEWMDSSSTSAMRGDPAERPFIADAIIANPPSFAHIHCAEKLGIPLHMMFTMPWSPTQAFPHPLANIQSSNADAHISNFMSYALVDMMTWQGLGDVINRFRHQSLGLEPISLMWGPALIPKPKDWRSHISISGFYFLNLATNYTPEADLREFLAAGSPPVYIGFGSIVVDDPNAMTELIFEAVKKTGQRALVSKGWGGFGADEFGIPEGVFMLGNVPHDWLFKHVSCVVHHGGAGTTAAGIAAGRPTVVVPFFGDQPFWGAMVNRGGAGPPPIPHKELTADNLAHAILQALEPSSLEKAAGLAEQVNSEKGSDNGAISFHQMLNVDKLRCSLCPHRAAVWRIRRTDTTLSALAATTLSNAGLLNFNELKLYRPREYETDDGPWDPITGGASAVIGTAGSMLMGIADFPIETLKALRIHPDSRSSSTNSTSKNSTERAQTTQSATSTTTSTSNRDSEETKAHELASNTTATSPLGVTSPTRTSAEEGSFPPRLEHTISQDSGKSPLSSSTSFSPITSHENNHRAILGSVLGDGRRRSGSNSRSQSRNSSPSRHCPLSPRSPGRERSHSRSHSRGPSVDPVERLDTMVNTGKGLSRIIGTSIKSPMDFSMSVARGFHNAPKLYGDDTVRQPDKITDLQSGLKAAGKISIDNMQELGYGFYDGITGLVKQPAAGAKKEGAAGFLKGVGKGLGGFLLKPGAGLWGLPGYTFKGVYQELQKHMGSNSLNYIIAARVTQGHEDWQNTTTEEKQEIIRKWATLKPTLKKKKNPGQEQLEHMHTFVSEHKERKRTWQERRKAKKSGSIPHIKTPDESQESIAPSELPAVPAITPGYAAELPSESLMQQQQQEDDEEEEAERAELEEAIRKSVAEASQGDPVQDEMIEEAIRASIAELDRARTTATESDEDAMKRAMHASLDEAQRFEPGNHEIHEQELEEALRRSMLDSGPSRSLPDSAPPPAYDEANASTITDAKQDPATSREHEEAEEDELHKAMEASKASYSEYENRDSATAREYEQAEEDDILKALDASKAAHEEFNNEMTRQKTEEDIVMEYIKKQSLAEEEHRQSMLAKGKGRVTNDDDDAVHEEELKKAIALSMHRDGEEGESSRG
ncbi:MAG: hypothetical protein Q9157_005069 [Trypethelium eluteriae]